jgi:protein TonB
MTNKVIKSSCILTAALLILGGCSGRKEQEQKETPAPEKVQTAVPPTAAPAPAADQAPAKPENAADDAAKPRLEYVPKPAYPIPMLARCIEGEARVTMRVTPEGRPDDIKITDSTNPAFSEALRETVPSWRFKPAEKDGVAVARTVSISIPFIINNRPVDIPYEISKGQPELLGVTRPHHPHKGPAKAVVQFTIASDTIVKNVEIVSSEGEIDRNSMLESLGQWVFLPSRYSNNQPTSKVLAEITFTQAGNVLIQYPYPTPTLPGESAAQPPQQ